MELTVLKDTKLKPSLQQASELPASEIAEVKKGTVIPVLAYRDVESHLIITIDGTKFDLKKLHPSGKNTWYCYENDLEDPTGVGPNNNPKDIAPTKLKDRGASFSLPGFSGLYYFGDPISNKAPNFTWGEALHYNGRTHRPPNDASVVYNVIKLAEVLEEVRRRFNNKTITINSWYRDPTTNRKVGGASQSRHLVGDAADIQVEGLTPYQVRAALESWWGIRGGLAAGVGFTHIDLRGYAARWKYPGA